MRTWLPYFIIGHSLFDIGYSGRTLPLHIGYSCLPAITRIAGCTLPALTVTPDPPLLLMYANCFCGFLRVADARLRQDD